MNRRNNRGVCGNAECYLISALEWLSVGDSFLMPALFTRLYTSPCNNMVQLCVQQPSISSVSKYRLTGGGEADYPRLTPRLTRRCENGAELCSHNMRIHSVAGIRWEIRLIRCVAAV